jgi:hypothetical protein
MAIERKTDLVIERRFDRQHCTHSMNGQPFVIHCHHYLVLLTQLAEDVSMIDGGALMAECAEDVFRCAFDDYFRDHNAETIGDRTLLVEEAHQTMGLGRLKVVCAGPESGEVELTTSHVDQGWVAKWGQRKTPVNYLTRGFVAAMFGALFSRAARSYRVTEVESIVSGASQSRFEAVAV